VASRAEEFARDAVPLRARQVQRGATRAQQEYVCVIFLNERKYTCIFYIAPIKDEQQQQLDTIAICNKNPFPDLFI
jgi:hypothetical protein